MSRFFELKVTGTGFARFSNSPISRVKEACLRGRTAGDCLSGSTMNSFEEHSLATVAELEVSVRGRDEENRSVDSKFAVGMWCIIGLYLFATMDGARFLSWQAAVYFVPGLYLASLVFGLGSYLLKQRLQQTALRMSPPWNGIFAGGAGLVLFVGEPVVMYLAAERLLRWAFS